MNNFSFLQKKQEAVLKNKQDNKAILSLINYQKYIKRKNEGILNNLTFAIKDNFAVSGTEMTMGSKILKGFKTDYSATIFNKLINQGAIPLFKTNLDELAMGGTGLTSGFQTVVNPFDSTRLIAGSSSGSAYLVAKGIVDFSIGSDTGDSVRKPAAYSGIVGFKPTWGLISRNGLGDFAPTWDTVGWFTNNVSLSAQLLDVLQGCDKNDYSSIESQEKNFFSDLNKKPLKKIKIGVITDMLKEIEEKEIFDKFNKLLNKLRDHNDYEVIDVNLNHNAINNILITYRIISSVEALSSNSNLTGFVFGNFFLNDGKTFNQQIINARSKAFTYEVKRRFLFGAESIINNERVYSQAKRVRYLIINELKRIFDKVEALVMPSHSKYAPKIPKFGEKVLHYESILDNYLGLFNANGSPSLTLPIYREGYKSVAVNVSTAPFNDKKCLQIAKQIEDLYEDDTRK